MGTENKSTATPRLRFPEFREAAWWDTGDVREIASVFQGFGFPEKHQGKTEGEFPFFKVSDISRSVEAGNHIIAKAANYIDSDTVKLLHATPLSAGSTIFAKIGEAIRSNRRAITGLPSLIDNNVAGVKAIKGRSTDAFIYHLFSTISLEDYAGGVVPAVNKSTIEGIGIRYPKLAEQQKIADCLTSLDEVIAAQGRKVAALGDHKRGLMQQLFPPEGETLPRLRFPEFQNAGEWVVKRLGKIFPITSSKRVHEADWTPIGVPFYRAREIVALNKHEPIQPLFISEELYAAYSKLTGEIRDGHLLVTGVGSIGIPYLVRAGDRFYFKDGNIIWFKNDGKELSGEFLHRLYETDYLQKQLKTMADVGTVATYTIDNAKRTLAVFPADKVEQQRIASCLSSLDDLINAEIEKLDTLKTHKKGLMQQLFPTRAEAEA